MRFKGGLDEKKFELPLDATKMESQSKILIDKSYSFGYSGKDMSETITHTRIEDSETGTSHLWINRVETVSGITKSFDEEQEGSVGFSSIGEMQSATDIVWGKQDDISRQEIIDAAKAEGMEVSFGDDGTIK